MQNRMDDLHTLIVRDRNHSSVVLWSMRNEVEPQYKEAFYAYLQEMRDECRRLNHSRPLSLALIGFCIGRYDDSTPLQAKLAAALKHAGLLTYSWATTWMISTRQCARLV